MTESVMMRDLEAMLARLRELKALGVRLALDDFGTGYSSLGYLQHLPMDVLKIDRRFVADVGHPHADPVVRTILMLAGALGLQTLAEGIETREQLVRLRALGCQLGQGYYFARPLAPAGLEARLRRPAGLEAGLAAD